MTTPAQQAAWLALAERCTDGDGWHRVVLIDGEWIDLIEIVSAQPSASN